MLRKILIVAGVLVVLSFTLVACAGPEGPARSAGPQGPARSSRRSRRDAGSH